MKEPTQVSKHTTYNAPNLNPSIVVVVKQPLKRDLGTHKADFSATRVDHYLRPLIVNVP